MSSQVRTYQGGKVWYTPPTGPMVLGEAPIYRSSDSTLHWVDCLKEPPELHILTLDPQSFTPIGDARVLVLEDSVSVVFFRKGVEKSYICAHYQGVAFMDEVTGDLDLVKEIIRKEERAERRFNDGGIDAKGRFWLAEIDKKAMEYGAGNLPTRYGDPKGRVWRYDPDGTLHEMDSGFVCGNGLAWSPDNKRMYINDSVGQKTFVYDYDLESGKICNKKLLIDFRSTDGEPDGMVLDQEGNLWMSVWGTNRVMVFDPQGTPLKHISFSGKNVTCPTWGGKEFDELFVTSALNPVSNTEEVDEGGGIFRFKPQDGVQGSPKRVFGVTTGAIPHGSR